jgi:hypothetical protein
VVSLSDPTRPEVRDVGQLDSGSAYQRLVVDGRRLYALARNRGLEVLDVSAPLSPRPVGFLPLERAHDLALHGRFLYLSTHEAIVVLALDGEGLPREVARLRPTASGAGIALAGVGDGLATLDRGLRLLDLGDPLRPTLLDTAGGPLAVTDAAGEPERLVLVGPAGVYVVRQRDR